MTERGFPIVDGAPACPFVAFEEDRDGRATAPDHRHRCFAEPRPAPRALAHQEAYCLSSAFPVCPTFQDWARREAAIARSSMPAPSEADEDDEAPAAIAPVPPLDLPDRSSPAASTPPPVPPRRPQPRDWAAPPPWAGDGEVGPGDAPYAAAAAYAAGSAAARPTSEDVSPPAFLAPKPAPSPDDDWGAASRGLAGSAADRLAGPDPDADAASYAPRPSADGPEDDAAWDPRTDAAGPSTPPTAGRATSPPVPGRRAPDRPPAAAPRRAPAHNPDDEPADLFGPAFGRLHRYEAYPTLRTRVGLPRVSGPAMAIVALVFAGAALFFVGPMLLGIGGDDEAARATPSPTVETSASPSPTLAPAPTPTIYIVVKGDTVTRIAKRNGVTVEALLAANPKVKKNPDKIKPGDEITIPVPEVEEAPEEVVESTVP